MPALRVQIPQVLEYAPVDYAAMPYEYAVVDPAVEYVEVEENATGAELMTGVGWCMYASGNFERLVLGCIEADFSTSN